MHTINTKHFAKGSNTMSEKKVKAEKGGARSIPTPERASAKLLQETVRPKSAVERMPQSPHVGGNTSGTVVLNGASTVRVSPIDQLINLNANLDQSRTLMVEALHRVGLFSLHGKEIGESVNTISNNYSSINAEFHDEGDHSAVAAMQLSFDLFANIRNMLNDIVFGIETKDVCGEDDEGDEDRSPYGAERTKSGRHVAELFDRFVCVQNQVRGLLDRVSISVLGNAIEMPTAAQRSSDVETMGILFMLDSVTDRTNNTMEAINALTYRINEVL